MSGGSPSSAESTSDHLRRWVPAIRCTGILQLRGYNRRCVGTPNSVFVVADTDQVVNAVDAAVASGKKLAVRSGGHCVEGLVDDPAVQCVIDLGQMDSVYYDRHRRAFPWKQGRRSVVLPSAGYGMGRDLAGGSCTGVGMGGHVTGGGFGPLSRLYGLLSDHLYAVETVVVGENGKAKAVTATREEDDRIVTCGGRTPVAVVGISVWQRNSGSAVELGTATTRHYFCRSGPPATRWPPLRGVGRTSTKRTSPR